MKTFFIIKDFLLSRNGLIFTASGVILLSILWLNTFKRADKVNMASSKPERTSAIWNIDSELPLQDVEQNQSFEPFIPQNPRPPLEVKSIPERVPIFDQATSIAETPDIPIVHEPLIKEEREQTPKVAQQPTATLTHFPKLEQGARIYCQLISSPSTDQKNSPILARVIRPLFRDGVLLIPIGSSVFGQIESASQKTLYPSHNWTVRTPSGKQLTVSALAYGQTTESLISRTGLTGHQEDIPPKKTVSKQLLGNVIKGIAALGKDTVRTGIGEYVPSTTRNAVINGSTQIIDGVLPNGETQEKAVKPSIYAPAGQEFTLVVSSAQKEPSSTPQSRSNIDQLLEQMLQKRLEE